MWSCGIIATNVWTRISTSEAMYVPLPDLYPRQTQATLWFFHNLKLICTVAISCQEDPSPLKTHTWKHENVRARARTHTHTHTHTQHAHNLTIGRKISLQICPAESSVVGPSHGVWKLSQVNRYSPWYTVMCAGVCILSWICRFVAKNKSLPIIMKHQFNSCTNIDRNTQNSVNDWYLW